MSEKRAFVIEHTQHDVTKAEVHAKVTYLFDQGSSRSSMWSSDFKEEILKRLKAFGYDPSYDYVVAAGTYVLVVIALTTIVASYGPIQLLVFDACDRQYRTLTAGERLT